MSASVLLAGVVLAVLPSASASADQCVVSVTLLGGVHLSFTVDVPPGTPLSALSLPAGLAAVASISESCAAPPPPAPVTPVTPPAKTTAPTSPGTSTQSPLLGAGTGGSLHPLSNSGAGKHHHRGPSRLLGVVHGNGQGSALIPAPKTSSGPTPAQTPAALGALRAAGGIPNPSNPTFSFALPGPAPLGVPNFFIDSFRIPPFLLPIYQAAGIEYDVPWQVLAAINEIETDYGRNLSISSSGAVGWMQFLPSTFKQYAVDAIGNGIADPYNPVDAIFTAARYLQAAGAAKNLPKAVFAYNHASWYVQSVLLRAKLIGGLPDQLIGALTGLVQGHFPVAAPAKYADDSVERLATRRVKGRNAAIPVDSNPASKGVSIFARQGAPVIAVNDGRVVKVGQNAKLGRYVELQDQTGNIYTYAQLGSIPSRYPVPKPVKLTAGDIAKELSVPAAVKAPTGPASAGAQQLAPVPSTTHATKTLRSAKGRQAKGAISLPVTSTSTPASPSAPAATPPSTVKERLFAHPSRPASYAAGGQLQLQNTSTQISSFQNYFSSVLHLGKNQYTLAPLKAGAIVIAGTILGRLAAPTPAAASHLLFMVQPAGKGAPKIDPKPILDGWKLLEATAVYRASGVDPFFGPGAKNPSVGQVLLMSKEQLTNRILQDPRVQIYTCGRRNIETGAIDRRVLAAVEFLSASGLNPTVSGLQCGHSLTGSTGTDAAGATGSSVDISKVNGIPILGHQGSGSITDITIRRLLTLQGGLKPDQIVSLMTYKGQSNTLALPDHNNRIQVAYTPLYGQNKKLSHEIKSILQPGQWIQLINRISQIPEPVVPVAPSKFAVRTGG
ncbi:MAG: lytic murein transglycosylase [Solirubrobacteraceae bacterium]